MSFGMKMSLGRIFKAQSMEKLLRTGMPELDFSDLIKQFTPLVGYSIFEEGIGFCNTRATVLVERINPPIANPKAIAKSVR
jgi:hypothetical protein